MFNIFSKHCFIILIALCFMRTEAMAQVLFSDDFEQESLGLDYDAFQNWDVALGTVDVIGSTGGASSFDLLAGQGHGLYLDMDGSSWESGTITSRQAFTLVPGLTYTLSFDLAGSQRAGGRGLDKVLVQLGVFSQVYSLAFAEPVRTITASILASAPTLARLSFATTGGDNKGLLLDNVKLVSSQAVSNDEPPVTAPVPGAAALLGSGLLGLAGLRRRARAGS